MADLVIGLLLAVITLDTLDRFYAVLLEQHYAVLSLTFGAFGTGHKAFLDPVHLLSLVDKQWRYFAISVAAVAHFKQHYGNVCAKALEKRGIPVPDDDVSETGLLVSESQSYNENIRLSGTIACCSADREINNGSYYQA